MLNPTERNQRSLKKKMVPKIRQEGDWSESVAKGMHPSDAKTTTASTSFFSTNHNDKYYYLTEDARKNLKTYNYRGVDMSLLYKYILSPLAAFLVNTIIPRSMAPNTITSIGFVLMISSYVAYWWYVPSLELTNNDEREDYDQFFPPRWPFVIRNSLCFLDFALERFLASFVDLPPWPWDLRFLAIVLVPS